MPTSDERLRFYFKCQRIFMKNNIVDVRLNPIFAAVTSPDGGIGRRAGLKHLCLHGHAGSTPALGTKVKVLVIRGLFHYMASVYILYSGKANRYYVGASENLEKRLDYHLTGIFKNSYTTKYDDWEIFFEIPNLSITTAIKIEAHIKKMKSKTYLQNLKQYPEMVQKLIVRFS